MDYQKIIIAGKIVSEPVIEKIEEGVLDQVTFKVSVHHFTKREIIFPVKAIGKIKNNPEFQEGKEILIEGIIDQNQSGEFFIFADYFQSEKSEEELLF